MSCLRHQKVGNHRWDWNRLVDSVWFWRPPVVPYLYAISSTPTSHPDSLAHQWMALEACCVVGMLVSRGVQALKGASTRSLAVAAAMARRTLEVQNLWLACWFGWSRRRGLGLRCWLAWVWILWSLGILVGRWDHRICREGWGYDSAQD